MISIGTVVHLFAGLLLAAMATFALLEAKSNSLIPKSLFLWPLLGLMFGLMSMAGTLRGSMAASSKAVLFTTGLVFTLCSLQAFLSNIRRIPRWPSGAVWLGLVLVALVSLLSYTGQQEPQFHNFYRHLTGFVWAAIGITKVAGEKSVSQEGGTPAWILLLYAQSILIASAPV